MTLKCGQYLHQHTLCYQVNVVEVPPPLVDKVVDRTGAGDAFLGGLIVGESLLPENESSTVQQIEKLQLKRTTAHK